MGADPLGKPVKNLTWSTCLALIASLCIAAAPGTQNGRKTYKWVDEQGLVHYGDRIPPEYATQERHVVNAQGVEVDKLEAQKTSEQVAADEQKKLDVAQRYNRDKNLLTTYATVQEIERLRDQRLALIADQVKVTNQFLEILHGRQAKLRDASMRFKPYSSDPNARPMPDQMAEDLVHMGNDIHTQEQNLREKRAAETNMRKQFQSDIDRFKELKAIH
jgi:hypothetical protein